MLIILVLVLLLKSNSKNDDKLNRLEINVIKEISDFKSDFSRSLTEDFNNQNERFMNYNCNNLYHDSTIL